MLNISNTTKAKYRSDEYTGEFKFVIDGTTYNSSHIKNGTVEITEALTSDNSINFASTEKGSLSVTLGNLDGDISDLIGKQITAYHVVNNEDVALGVYTITSSQNNTTNFVDIDAYDNLELFDVDVSSWWNSEIAFPITMRNLLIALCNKCGVLYSFPNSFTNSTYQIKQNILLEGVTGLEMLGYIQEICACFVKPNRMGTMQLITLPTEAWDTYDADYTFSVGETVSDLRIADYITDPITKVQVRGTADDVGIIVGSGDNAYIIESNPLLTYIEDSSLDKTMLNNILSVVSHIQYRPFSGTFRGLPYIEVGDFIRVNTITDLTAYGVLLSRVLHGAGIRRDDISVQGEQTQQLVTKTSRSVRILKQQTHELVNTVDTLRSTITEQGEQLSNSVTRITYYWLVNDGETPQVSDHNWTTDASIEWGLNKHKWQKTVTEYINRPPTNQIVDLTEPNLLDIETWYYLSSSVEKIEDDYLYFRDDEVFNEYQYFSVPINATWTQEKPEPIAGRFLWTRFKKIYSDGSEVWTEPVVDRDFNKTYQLIYKNSTDIIQTNETVSAKADTEYVLNQYNALTNEIEQERLDRHSEITETSSNINLHVSEALSGKANKIEILHIAVDNGVTPTPEMQGWTDGTVQKNANQQVWQIIKTHTTDPTDMSKDIIVYSGLANITGAQGESGANAASSEVYEQRIRYIASNSGTVKPAESANWKVTISETGITEGQYLWTWTWIQWGHKGESGDWILDTSTSSYSVSYWSKDGQDGVAGKYITAHRYRYKTSTSMDTYSLQESPNRLYFDGTRTFGNRTYFWEPIASDSDWSTTRPTEFVAGHYLWVEDTPVYDDGTTGTVTYSCDYGVASSFDVYAMSKADVNILKDSVSIWAEEQTSLSNQFLEYQTKQRAEINVKTNEILSKVSATYQTKDDMIGYYTKRETQTQIDQTATSITSAVSETYQTKDAMKNYSNTKSVKSMIQQFANSITLTVGTSSGKSTGISIKSTDIDGTEHTSSGTITLSGDVVIKSNLTDGSTEISGNNITTGTIDANRISTSIARTSDIPTKVSQLTDASNYAKTSNAESRSQLIYISKASGTNSVSANTTWVTNAKNEQNTWTIKRPTYDSSYPVLFVALQRQTVAQRSGTTCSCTTPIKDDTTTVIDGGHITTGTIDASAVNVTNINATNIKSGTLNSITIGFGGEYGDTVQLTPSTITYALPDGTRSDFYGVALRPNATTQKNTQFTIDLDAVSINSNYFLSLYGKNSWRLSAENHTEISAENDNIYVYADKFQFNDCDVVCMDSNSKAPIYIKWTTKNLQFIVNGGVIASWDVTSKIWT